MKNKQYRLLVAGMLLVMVASWLPAMTHAAAPLVPSYLAAALPSPQATQLATMVPSATALPQATPLAHAITQMPVPPPPVYHTTSPQPVPHLPSLLLNTTLSSKVVVIGSIVTATISVFNQAPDAAQNLVVSMTVPSGTVALPTARQNWNWNVGQLAGGSSLTLTTTLQVVGVLDGGALLLQPQASADGLSLPVTKVAGAIAIDHLLDVPSVTYTPGQSTTLRSGDGSITVSLPAAAYTAALTLRHSWQPLPGNVVVTSTAGLRRSLGAFYLNATDTLSQSIHQFNQPLTLTVQYTPQQLQALGVSEGDLALYWYDEGSQQWTKVASTVDLVTHSVTAAVNHFSAWQIGDGSSPSSAFIPSLQGFQAGLYSGSTSYSYPIEVPAGAGGMRPSVQLSYSSAASDGSSGKRQVWQASWVGEGWSLDPGAISFNAVQPGASRASMGYYTLVLNGQSYNLVREAGICGGTCNNDDPSQWDWRTSDESFMRVRVFAATPQAGKGIIGGPRYYWQVWAKDGTTYLFAEDVYWAWYCNNGGNPCGINNSGRYIEANSWKLSQVSDPYGNTINYSYSRTATQPINDLNYTVIGYVDTDVWLDHITWGGNSVQHTPDRYQVVFDSYARTNDNNYASFNGPALAQYQPHQTRQLFTIRVQSNSAGTWDLVSQYNLGYSYDLRSDYSLYDKTTSLYSADNTTAKLTLIGIQQVGNDAASYLPGTSFSYGTTRGTGLYPNGDWNRLTGVNNGRGGSVSLGYDNIGAYQQAVGWGAAARLFDNNRRVLARVLNDGRGQTATWYYNYGSPAYNWRFGDSSVPTGKATNSATLYNGYQTNPGYLAEDRYKEFRGHDWVAEVDPYGTKTTHWFVQGDLPCAAATTLTSSCYSQLINQEFLKGREYRTTTYNSAGTALSQVDHSLGVNYYDNSSYINTVCAGCFGIWRAFTYEGSTTETSWNNGSGGSEARSKTTVQTLDPNQYGNLTHTELRDTSNSGSALLRYTDYRYATPAADTHSPSDIYIANHHYSEEVYAGNGTRAAMTFYFYDGAGFGYVGSKGSISTIRKFFNVPAGPGITNYTLHGTDTGYHYDLYGNQDQVSTYASDGTATYNGTSWAISAPGSGSAPRTSSTSFDGTFHAFPILMTMPAVNSVALTQQVGYNYLMGTLTSSTDANGNITQASYDTFGRLTKVVRPGDSFSSPTTEAIYNDWNQPTSYTVLKRPYANTPNNYLPTTGFYDGLGRQIQTKTQGQPWTTGIVVDRKYDLVGRLLQEGQARAVTQDATTLFQFATPPATLSNPVTYSYDALGRPLQTTYPDNTTIANAYTTFVGGGPSTD